MVEKNALHSYDQSYRFISNFLNKLNRSPFYYSKLSGVKQYASIKDLPFTLKDELTDVSPFDLLAVSQKEISHYHESSGTTGQPSAAWFTKEDLANSGKQINTAGVGLHEEDLILIRFPFSLFLPAYLIQQAAYQVNASIIPASSRNTVTPYPKILSLLKDLNVTVLAGIPREMELLAETARLLNYDIVHDFKSLRGILVAGELLSPSRRQHLEKLWNTSVYNLYGSTETGNMAAMCNQGSLHFSMKDYFIEVYDDSLIHPLPIGNKGQAVITTLSNRACPLLRYVNGDIVSLHQGECSCGSLDMELRHYGRVSDRINFGQQKLDAYDIQEAVYTLPTVPVAWRLTECDDHLDVELQFSDEQLVNQTFAATYLEDKLGGPIRLTIVEGSRLLDYSLLLNQDTSKKPQYIIRKKEETHE